jgi:DNA-binding NtrC family response regulator
MPEPTDRQNGALSEMMSENHARLAMVIIDDNPGSLEMLAAALSETGVEIHTASDPEEGVELVYQNHPQIVLTDLRMPKLDGLEVLDRVIEFDPAIDVVLMTGHYSSESAVEAIQRGASDYLNKPVSIATLRERITQLVNQSRGRQRAMALEGELMEASQFRGMIGNSPQMLELFSRIRRVAPHFRTLLVTGQTGTGKDLVARAIYDLSPAKGRFVVLNCSAVVETLFESELFGHVKGAFTGATQDKMGLVEYSSGGVLFLDEIGDMPMSTQAKLLRTLQNQEIQSVGSLTPRRVDLRVIAATHHDLRAAIAEKRFREDLYYRLAMVEIQTPRLAEHPEDIPLLTRHFVSKFAQLYGKQIRGLTHRAQIALSRHQWPGNVRELENAIGHAAMMVMNDTIDAVDLPAHVRHVPSDATPATSAQVTRGEDPQSLESHERLLLFDAMARSNGNQCQAARLLRIGRDALRYKLKKYELQ